MSKMIKWFTESNRWKHLLGGIAVGAGADSWYCAAYAGIGVAGAFEYKDKAWGGSWDWVDFTLTIAGCAIGRGIRALVL